MSKSKRDDVLLLEDMYESSLKITRYTANLTFAQFQADEKTIDAVVRNFEIIGEAANHISTQFREDYLKFLGRIYGDFGTELCTNTLV